MGWSPGPKPKPTLEERVTRAAEDTLANRKYVSGIDILTGIGLLAHSNVESWRKGRLRVLEEMIQGSPEKVGKALRIFHAWAESRDLVPVEVRYVRNTLAGEEELRFTETKYPELDGAMRAQYASKELSATRKQKLQQRLSKPAERVVFWNLRDSKCTECGTELPADGFLFMEGGQPLCLACANLGDLEYLPAGDATLTRRATKYSDRHAVVVRFSRSRKRYERQGILVAEEAIRRAEEECAADAPARAVERQRAAADRVKEDAVLVKEMTAAIQEQFPGCPPAEAKRIAGHTSRRGSGTVGRSKAGKRLDPEAVKLAVIAAVRHNHTDYDELLAQGVERVEARERVRDKVNDVIEKWAG